MATIRPKVSARPMAVPGLADLTQDIAGRVSVSLLNEWTSGDRTPARATSILAPYRRVGVVGASDASGLSKLTQERDLFEVLWMVAEPKQILYGVGKAIGGEAIGIWGPTTRRCSTRRASPSMPSWPR